MEHHLEPAPFKGLAHCSLIQQIGLDQLTLLHSLLMPGGQVIQHHHRDPLHSQQASHMAADVSRPTTNQNLHCLSQGGHPYQTDPQRQTNAIADQQANCTHHPCPNPSRSHTTRHEPGYYGRGENYR